MKCKDCYYYHQVTSCYDDWGHLIKRNITKNSPKCDKFKDKWEERKKDIEFAVNGGWNN